MSIVASGTSAFSYAGLALLNITASVLSAYYPSSPAAAGAIASAGQGFLVENVTLGQNAICAPLTADKQKLIFGDMKGLLPQPENPEGRCVPPAAAAMA